MTAKEKAIELVEKFKPRVYPFFGSGMLSNTEDEGTILTNAKAQAIICVDEILDMDVPVIRPSDMAFWEEVKREIEKL